METTRKKIKPVFDYKKDLQEKVLNSAIIKYIVYGASSLGVVLAIGFSVKVITYTIKNINELKNTLN